MNLNKTISKVICHRTNSILDVFLSFLPIAFGGRLVRLDFWRYRFMRCEKFFLAIKLLLKFFNRYQFEMVLQ